MNEIDYWQEIRNQAAIAAMQSIIETNPKILLSEEVRGKGYTIATAMAAVRYADALIAALKNKEE